MDPKDLMVLGTIINGIDNFTKLNKKTKIPSGELDSIIQRLKERGFIEIKEKKGWLGTKIEIRSNEKGQNEFSQRIHELEEDWNGMAELYKSGNTQQLKQIMDERKNFLPTMMFFGIIDVMMFSAMFSMMGLTMSNYLPTENIQDMSDGFGDSDFGDGGFDIDIGF